MQKVHPQADPDLRMWRLGLSVNGTREGVGVQGLGGGGGHPGAEVCVSGRRKGHRVRQGCDTLGWPNPGSGLDLRENQGIHTDDAASKF